MGVAASTIVELEKQFQVMLLHQMALREQIEFSIRLNREGNLISKAILEGKARLHPGSYVIPDTPYTDQDRVKSQAEEKLDSMDFGPFLSQFDDEIGAEEESA